MEYNPIYNCNSLIIKPVTKSMALQRKGRVGRKHPGIFYPMYTKNIFDYMQDIQYPEIHTEDLSKIMLNIINIKYKDDISKFIDSDDLFENLINKKNKYNNIKFLKNINIYKLDLLDNPSHISINNALSKLYNFGLIFANGYPTKLGLLINKIRNISIENAIMILSGFQNNSNILDLVTIAAYNSMQKNKLILNRFKSFNSQFETDKKLKDIDLYNYNKLKTRLFISCEFIDFLLFFYKFQQIIEIYKNDVKKIQEFCFDNKVNYIGLMQLIEIRDEILKDLIFNMNINPMINSHINLYTLLNSYNKNDNLFIEAIEEIIKIKKCIYEGFKLNIAFYNEEKNKYFIKNTNKELIIDSYLTRNLPLFNSGKHFETKKPNVILFDSLIIKKNSDNNNYEFTVGNSISILSGYINIDNNF